MSFYRIEGAESVELQAFYDCLVEYRGRQDLGDLYAVLYRRFFLANAQRCAEKNLLAVSI